MFNTLNESQKTGFSIPSSFYSFDKTFIIGQNKQSVTSTKTFEFDLNDFIADSTSIRITKIKINSYSSSIIEYVILSKEGGVWTSDIQPSVSDIESVTLTNNNVLVVVFINNVLNDNTAEVTFTATDSNTNDVYFCKQKECLFILSNPISRNGDCLFTGSKNNILNLIDLPTVKQDDLINNNPIATNDCFLDIETYYGVLCYLIRLYSGRFDLYELIKKQTEYGISDKVFYNGTKSSDNKYGICTFDK